MSRLFRVEYKCYEGDNSILIEACSKYDAKKKINRRVEDLTDYPEEFSIISIKEANNESA